MINIFKKKNKIYAIADLHLGFKVDKSMEVFGKEWEGYLEKISKDWKSKVKKNDIVLIAGDISWAMKTPDANEDLEWISKLPGKKIMIRGNHDYWWSSKTAVRKILPKNMFIIDNDSLKMNGFLFCGTRGWSIPEKNDKQKESDEKIYKREINRLEMSLKDAKKNQDNEKIIAMIHYPPFNSSLDSSPFTELFEKYNVDKVVYGHLHGSDSRSVMEFNKNGIDYYLTSCDKLKHKLKRIF